MNEITRIGLPQIVGQGEQIARSRGTMSGGELVLQELGAQASRKEAVQRAEHIRPTGRVEPTGKRGEERRRDESGRRGDGRDDEDGPDDGAGRTIDVMA